jgi:hypothetical protein
MAFRQAMPLDAASCMLLVMDGVKTAIVGFIFVCIILPHLIKIRAQYFMAVAVFLVGMVFNLLAFAFTPSAASMELPGGFVKFCLVADGVCQIGAVILLFLSAGGMSIGQLAGEFGRAYEVMRRGEDQKTVIIPLSGQQRHYVDEDDEEDAPARCEINTEPSPPPPPDAENPPSSEAPPPTSQEKPSPGSTIPLE